MKRVTPQNISAAGLRGDDIPDDVRITKVSDVFDTIETAAPGEFRYIVEIKYPHPWAPEMLDKLYNILKERNLTDRVNLREETDSAVIQIAGCFGNPSAAKTSENVLTKRIFADFTILLIAVF